MNGERIDAEHHINHNFVEYDGPTHFREGMVAIRFSMTDYDKSVSNEEKFKINDFFNSLNLGDHF